MFFLYRSRRQLEAVIVVSVCLVFAEMLLLPDRRVFDKDILPD
jgi:hypothetical protein